jgi:hypothetical protein
MISEAMTGHPTPPRGEGDPALLKVLDSARRFIAFHERAAAIAAGKIPPPRTLAEAIDRDFLAFDLERAARELREAVIEVNARMVAPPIVLAPPPGLGHDAPLTARARRPRRGRA